MPEIFEFWNLPPSYLAGVWSWSICINTKESHFDVNSEAISYNALPWAAICHCQKHLSHFTKIKSCNAALWIYINLNEYLIGSKRVHLGRTIRYTTSVAKWAARLRTQTEKSKQTSRHKFPHSRLIVNSIVILSHTNLNSLSLTVWPKLAQSNLAFPSEVITMEIKKIDGMNDKRQSVYVLISYFLYQVVKSQIEDRRMCIW